MPRFLRNLPLSRAYASELEKWVPRLEEQLYRRLERLEVKVVKYELRQGTSQPGRTCREMRKPSRPVKADLGIGRPSVVVLGARLRSDQRYCRTLIERVAAVLRAGFTGFRRGGRATIEAA
jgi:hypothetical protein